jgi:hypothetical protein
MSRIIILDSGPLGMAVHPTAKGVAQQCQTWLNKLLQQGERIAIPEIADYVDVGFHSSIQSTHLLVSILI